MAQALSSRTGKIFDFLALNAPIPPPLPLLRLRSSTLLRLPPPACLRDGTHGDCRCQSSKFESFNHSRMSVAPCRPCDSWTATSFFPFFLLLYVYTFCFFVCWPWAASLVAKNMYILIIMPVFKCKSFVVPFVIPELLHVLFPRFLFHSVLHSYFYILIYSADVPYAGI